jgi:small-conductance mechanosensitive channel
MQHAVDWLGRVSGLGSEAISKLLLTIGIALVVLLLRWVWIAVANHRTEDPGLRYRWRKVANYTLTIAGLILVARVWIQGIQSLVTYLGLLSAGLAVALRDPIVNWFGWIFIGWRRPFKVGDRIQIGTLLGDVIDIGVSTFSILEVSTQEAGEQTTGRIVHVPNGKVFVEPLVNTTQGFNYVWNEIRIMVTFESDWRRAKEILENILRGKVDSITADAARFIRDASRRFLIRSANLKPLVYTSIAEDGVALDARYVCEARSRRRTTEEICEAVLDAFTSESRIDFAYRTSRIFRQTEEGKPSFRQSPSAAESP